MIAEANKFNISSIPAKVSRTKFSSDALFIIRAYPMRAQELLLDAYLRQHYKKSLKNICIELLSSCTLHQKEKSFLILYKNPEHDKLAQLITYGNALVGGSNILKYALNQKRG
jgi:hypothetical protein